MCIVGCTWTGPSGATIPTIPTAKTCPNTGYGVIGFQLNGQLSYVAPDLTIGFLINRTQDITKALRVQPMGSALLTVNGQSTGGNTYLGGISTGQNPN